ILQVRGESGRHARRRILFAPKRKPPTRRSNGHTPGIIIPLQRTGGVNGYDGARADRAESQETRPLAKGGGGLGRSSEGGSQEESRRVEGERRDGEAEGPRGSRPAICSGDKRARDRRDRRGGRGGARGLARPQGHRGRPWRGLIRGSPVDRSEESLGFMRCARSAQCGLGATNGG